jgi:hypothetical protein
LRSSW